MLKLPSIQLQPRERLLAMGAGLVVLAIALDQLVLSPWWQYRQKVQQGIRSLEEALQADAKLLARKDSVLSRHQEHQRYLRPVVADDLQKAELIKEIELLADQTNVLLGDVKSSEVEATPTARQLAFDLQFECTLEEWVHFVHRLESSPTLYEIVRAGVTRDEAQKDRLQAFLRLVSASLQPDEQQPASLGDTDARTQ